MEPSNYPREKQPEAPPPPRQVPNWISATVIGSVFLMLFILWTRRDRPLQASIRSAALTNLKQCGLAAQMYAGDNNERLPSADHWMDLVEGYAKGPQVFRSPVLKAPNEFGLAFRASLSTDVLSKIPNAATTALVFDSTDTKWNANGELNLLPNPPRYGGRNCVCFADGHVRGIPAPGIVVR